MPVKNDGLVTIRFLRIFLDIASRSYKALCVCTPGFCVADKK